MAICNDRRWPETYRVMGLQGVEMIVLGYNTPVHNPPSPEHDNLAHFHNELVMQAGAYQNGCFVVGVAKAGDEDGVRQIGNSIVVAPSGEIVAACTTEGDELAIARCDLDLTRLLQEHDVQLRAAPAAAGVRAHRRAQGRDTAAGGRRWRAVASRLRRPRVCKATNIISGPRWRPAHERNNVTNA